MKTDTTNLTIDSYIAQYPASTQKILNKIRNAVREVAPDATEKMSYGIPTLWQKRNIIHYGAYPNHIGIYPGPRTIELFQEQLTIYETSKGTIKLPLDKPIPYDLIRNLTEFSVNSSK
jgi:uncharacterized protein YdhG (YjbR/CyaY superfamily)